MVLDSLAAHYRRRQSPHRSQMAHQAAAYPGFCRSMSDYEYFYSPLDRMLVHRRVTLSIYFTLTHLYTSVEKGTMRVKCPAQEHYTMSMARARTKDHSSIWRGPHWPRSNGVSSL